MWWHDACAGATSRRRGQRWQSRSVVRAVMSVGLMRVPLSPSHAYHECEKENGDQPAG